MDMAEELAASRELI